MSKVKHQQTQ